MTQNNLGNALSDQGVRAGGKEGVRLLSEAVAAYKKALEVRTLESLPPQWAQTQNNIAETYYYLKDWTNAVESYANVLKVYPNYEKAYQRAGSIYHDLLFEFSKAFELDKNWLERHPDDISALSSFAEKHFTTNRFTECEKRIESLLANPDVDSHYKIVLRTIEIANLLAIDDTELIPTKMDTLIESIANQSENFKVNWTFNGTKHFIRKNGKLARYREWLLKFFQAIEG